MAVSAFNILSLCSGIGGLDLGISIAVPGARTVCHVERESYAAACLVARMAEASIPVAPIWDCIDTFDGKPWRGVVDCISAGDPCQPWSHAGQRKGYDDERVVFDDVARIVDEVQPEFVFLENVAGAIDFRWDCKAVLESMGYRVEAGLFSAAEVGAPHGRLRVFLLGHARPRSRCAEQGCEREVQGGESGAAGPRLDDPQERSMRHDRKNIGQKPRDVNTLADAGAQLQHAPHDSAIEGVSVADTAEQGREESLATRGRQDAEEVGAGLDGGLERQGGGMADTSESRCEERRGIGVSCQARSGVTQGESTERDCLLPLFPPRPNDLDTWREVLEATAENGPCVEPAIRRMADWTTYRVERLQALGNAVVPLTAALAFRTLWGRLMTKKGGA